MRQFQALFFKEFKSFFQSSFAYVILFIYVFVVVGGAFYFGSYLTMRDAAVYSLFYTQPIILTVLLPALTMRLWSEEYKSGTAEFLLTQPINSWQPTIAKFLAATLFGIIMTLFLLPFVVYTSQYISLDIANIFSSYCGLWLFVMLYCAVGVLISALNKHIIISYLLSVFIMALWLAIPATKLYEAYTDFLLAEVGIFDAVYFILFTAVLVYLQVLVPNFRYSSQKNKTIFFILFAILIFIGTSSLIISGNLLFTAKLDLTAQQIYTPQKQTKELLAKIKTPLSIDLYIAKDFRTHNVEYFRYYQQVKRFLQKYQALSGGLIRFSVTEVEPFSQLEDMVLRYGLYYEENIEGTKDYFGAVVRDNSGHGVTIKQLTAARSAYLEKDIDSALLKLVDGKQLIKSIGVYMDTMQDLEPYNGFLLNLEEDYNVFHVTDDVYEISPQADMLILVNPKLFSGVFRYAVDQYIMRGGKVLVLFDVFSKNQNEYINEQMLGIIDFFDKWGILLGDKLVNEGIADNKYYKGDLPLNIYKAAEFAVINSKLQVTPVIKGKYKYIGAVVEGSLPSLYMSSPHKDKKMRSSMFPHMSESIKSAKVALVGDVDLIDDVFWLDEKSSDKNPYSAVYNASNMELVRNLIDSMLEVNVYRNLPLRKTENMMSIGQQVYNSIYNRYAPRYLKINEKIAELKSKVYTNNNINKAEALINVGQSGKLMAELKKKSDELLYQFKSDYNSAIKQMMLLNIVLVPIISIFGLVLLVFLLVRRKLKKIQELFDE